MAVYFLTYAATSDNYVRSSSTTYATARSGANLFLGSVSLTAGYIGQYLDVSTYYCLEYFLSFDTSALSGSISSVTVGLTTTGVQPTSQGLVAYEKAWNGGSVATTDWVAGESLSGLTQIASCDSTPTTGDQPIRLTGNPSSIAATSTYQLLVTSHSLRDGNAPPPDNITVHSADATGTTLDPFLLVLGTPSPWVFVGVGTSVQSTATSHTLTEPAGVQEGDLLVACISSRIASTTSITLPTGGEWTRVSEQKTSNTATNTSATASGMMAYCVRGASAPNLTFTHPVAPSVALGRIVAYRNVNRTAPFDVGNSATTATNTTAVNVAAGVTTAEDDELLVGMFAGGQEATVTDFAAATSPTGSSGTLSSQTSDPIPMWQERAEQVTTTGADTSLAIFDAVKPSAGATGNITCTASQGAAHVIVVGAFKLAPAAKSLVFNHAPFQFMLVR